MNRIANRSVPKRDSKSTRFRAILCDDLCASRAVISTHHYKLRSTPLKQWSWISELDFHDVGHQHMTWSVGQFQHAEHP